MTLVSLLTPSNPNSNNPNRPNPIAINPNQVNQTINPNRADQTINPNDKSNEYMYECVLCDIMYMFSM